MNEPMHQLSDWVREYTEELYSWAFYKVTDEELENGKKARKFAWELLYPGYTFFNP